MFDVLRYRILFLCDISHVGLIYECIEYMLKSFAASQF